MSSPVVVYPDAELVGLAILDSLDGEVDTFLRSGWAPPWTLVNRIGGAPDNSDVTDFPILRVACYGDTRMDAWNMAAQAEALMIGARYNMIPVPLLGEGVEILVDSVDIVVGGQQLPDVEPDDRRVVKDFILGLRRPYYLLSTP